MKRFITATTILLLLIGAAFDAEAKSNKSRETKELSPRRAAAKEKRLAKKEYERLHKVKTGWNFGPFPAISYNSDRGFQYGALCDIFYFGDGSKYPDYLHKFNVELSRYTKGEMVAHLFYDSKYLIPGGIRLTAAATYLNSPMSPFYGFNGFAAPYNYDFVTKKSPNYNPAFYAINREMVRALADIQFPIAKNLHGMFGLTFWDIKTQAVKLRRYQNAPSLFNIYREAGLITPTEVSGTHLDFKIGLIYDTRDHEAAPNRGHTLELVALTSTDLRGTGHDFYRIYASWRQFFSLGKRVVLAYRLGWQESFGNAPFYMHQLIQTSYLRQIRYEGLGGMNTVRGVLQNRILGQGYAWANFEARVRIVNFRFIKQMWYIALNPFVDLGVVTRNFRLDQQKAAAEYYPIVYSGTKRDGLHGSAGIGAKLVMNQNFILSLEWGKTFDKRDGKHGMNIGINYIF